MHTILEDVRGRVERLWWLCSQDALVRREVDSRCRERMKLLLWAGCRAATWLLIELRLYSVLNRVRRARNDLNAEF
jgi:hypothetical protein